MEKIVRLLINQKNYVWLYESNYINLFYPGLITQGFLLVKSQMRLTENPIILNLLRCVCTVVLFKLYDY